MSTMDEDEDEEDDGFLAARNSYLLATNSIKKEPNFGKRNLRQDQR